MKHVYALLFLLGCLSFTQAQFKKQNWSPAFDPKGTPHLVGTYADGNEKVAIIYSDKQIDPTAISVVLADQAQNTANVFHHKFDKPMFEIVGGYHKENSFVVIYEYKAIEGSEAVQQIRALEIKEDESTEETVLASFGSTNSKFLGNTKFAQSPDLKKALVFIESPYNSGQKEEVTLLTYNEGNEDGKFTVNLDLDSKQNVHNYPQLANNGTVYFLKKDKDKNQHRYFLYSFNPTAKVLNHKLVALTNTFISEIKGQVTEQNEFLVGGFTSSDMTHGIEGYYLFKFDQSCSQKFKTQGQLDEQTFLKFMSKKEYSKDPVLKGFYMDNIIVLPSGKIFLAAEAYKEEEGKEYTWSMFKDIMLVSFDENGKYKTTFKHEKNQSVNADYSHWASYKTYPNKDTLVIVHNYLVKTEGAKKPEPLFTTVNVHEKYGTRTIAAVKPEAKATTPFFYPELVYVPGRKQYIALFTNFELNSYRIGYFDLE